MVSVNETSCIAFFESTYAHQSACADYRAALMQAYVAQGFLRPSGGHEEWLSEQVVCDEWGRPRNRRS